MAQESLYLSKPIVEIGGQQATPELIKDLMQITIEESLHLPAMFTLVVHNSYLPTNDKSQYQPWRHEKVFEIGKKVRLGFISSTTQDQNFKLEKQGYLIDGEITAIEVHFNQKSEAPIIVRGYDTSHRLHRGRQNRSFLNNTDSDIVRKVAQEVGIQLGKIDESGNAHEYVFQENQTNMEFLRERAARIGFELFIEDGKINFRKPEAQEAVELKWLDEISSFSTRVTSAEQVSAVEVRSWDYQQKKLITSKAQAEKVITDTGNLKGSNSSNKFNISKPPLMTVVDKPVATAKEADVMAQALCDELGGEFVYADAKAEGNPKIRPGRFVSLQKMGDRFSGKYYITDTRHFYSQRVYTTEFSVRGLRSGNLYNSISPQTRLQPGQTFLVGIVTNNQDPKGLSRVKVKFPTLTEEHESYWARMVSIGAGSSRGTDWLPEINDEVLVGFEHGDIHRPYIIGTVWNGQDTPPTSVKDSVVGGRVRLRTLKTRIGHQLQFVDEDKARSYTGIYIETKGRNKISINDTRKFIEIKTARGQKILVNDLDGSISIKANATISNTATAAITSRATAIDTTAGGAMTMKSGAAMSMMSGAAISMTATGAITITTPGLLAITAGTMTLTTTLGPITMTTPITGPKPIP
ncbi:VgrG-related protein [Plectonema cf. radiosum LEGE 06105]|uniref:VgrG-related protein n=1 Tax=Plectonema cf. radiosum LEGE 06105 TaxID=945769 RepID=A0A8J7JVY7_9CYAN|nr:VgrG-related protein [Plectonema radiosum]MBE9215050.1 VgrG-related protein [Plectonema cf. radiosum LEGE 06105]